MFVSYNNIQARKLFHENLVWLIIAFLKKINIFITQKYKHKPFVCIYQEKMSLLLNFPLFLGIQ